MNFNAKLDAAAAAADIVVANVGVWYDHSMEAAYRADVDYTPFHSSRRVSELIEVNKPEKPKGYQSEDWERPTISE